MSTSENKKNGARFNLFDVLLILAVVGCIVGLALHAYFTEDLNETYSETANISFVVSGVSEQTATAFSRPGATIFSQENDRTLGTLMTVSFSPLTVDAETASGLLVKAQHPEKKEITAVASFYGTWTEDGFFIGGNTLATIGKSVKIYTEDAVCTITITGVSH